MHVIGIAGKKYHGKDSVARELVTLGYKVVRFAGPLKSMLRAFYTEHGIAPAEIERKIEGDLKEVPCPLLCGRTPRHAMQTLGEEWGRQLISRDLWVESLAYRAEASGATKVVVPDVRYANEAATIEGIGGEVWRVAAAARVAPTAGSGHASEEAVDTLPVTKEIDNNGTLFELSRAVRAALQVDA